MSSGDLILALGIPKSTYYGYLDAPDYPLDQPFGVQKAWVDAKQVESGAKAEAPRRSRRDEDEGPNVAEQIKLEELAQAHMKTLKMRAEIDETYRDLLARGGEIYILRRTKAILSRLQLRMYLLCTDCKGRLSQAVSEAEAELDAAEDAALREIAVIEQKKSRF
jgi:hypothetical protein